MKKLLTLLVAAMLLSGAMGVGKAQAYFISFDPDGAGASPSYQLDAFNFTGVSIANPYGGTTNILTYQDLATGVFTEQFTLRVPSGTNSGALYPLDSISFVPPFFVDVFLTGVMDMGTNTVNFSGGSATMYSGTPQYDALDALDTLVATLGFNSALPTFLQDGLIGSLGDQLVIDITFKFLTLNSAYFGAGDLALANQGILFGLTQNAIALDNIYYTDATYNIVNPAQATELVLAWTHQGGIGTFATPEPGTALLMGFGLIGLAAVGRRRKN